MLKEISVRVVAGALILILGVGSTALANSRTDKQREATDKVKAGIKSLGTGPDTHVQVKLRDKTKLSGSISEANDESFIITDGKTGVKTTVAYPDVAQVKGQNWVSKKTIIITAVIVGTLAIIYLSLRGKRISLPDLN